MSTKSTRNYWLATLFITGLFVFPAAAEASVIINEIMYNPEGADSGREWVELYNEGESEVTIVGGSGSGSWRLVDSSNHTITDPQGGVGRGTLTIPAQGYLVLASDPSTVMNEYSGDYAVAKASLTLNNTGTTVSLIDGSGKTVDSVTYSSSEGGSDNGTSLQLASDSWLQALPTPAAPNATESYSPPVKETSSKSNTTANPGYVAPPLPQVFADAGDDRTVIVGADAKFVATAYDRDRDVITYAKFYWNFGDGASAEGPEVMHHFSYPGRYAVELTVTNTKIKSVSRITVTAEPASLLLAQLPNGGVSVQNKSDRDLDISFWIIKDGEQSFTLPEHSVVLKGAAVNIAATTLGFEAQEAKLYYPNGKEVIGVGDTHEPVPASTVSIEAREEAVLSAPLSTVSMSEPEAIQSTSTPEPVELAAAAATSDATLPLWASLAGLTGLVGAGVASVWAVRKREVTSGQEEEFTIE